MQHYDPRKAPDPKEWLALDDYERINLTWSHYRSVQSSGPNARLQATVHAVIETQIALGDATPAHRTAQRLMNEGLDRDEAIEAISSLFAKFIHELMNGPESANAPYFAALERLTAEDWRRSR
jgi:hypothetical protein